MLLSCFLSVSTVRFLAKLFTCFEEVFEECVHATEFIMGARASTDQELFSPRHYQSHPHDGKFSWTLFVEGEKNSEWWSFCLHSFIFWGIFWESLKYFNFRTLLIVNVYSLLLAGKYQQQNWWAKCWNMFGQKGIGKSDACVSTLWCF